MTVEDPSRPIEEARPVRRGLRSRLGRGDDGEGLGLRRMATFTAVVGLALFGLIQVLPFGRNHTNPPVTGEPAWATPRTRELAVRACYDCHSNETQYPWYSNVAPLSWWLSNHVTEGRLLLNFSEFTTNPGRKVDDTIEVVNDGGMPPNYFTMFGLHAAAKLTDAERAELVAGLKATPGFADQGGSRRSRTPSGSGGG
jgi:hypothetical protein